MVPILPYYHVKLSIFISHGLRSSEVTYGD
jgi:hypothetical protein